MRWPTPLVLSLRIKSETGSMRYWRTLLNEFSELGGISDFFFEYRHIHRPLLDDNANGDFDGVPGVDLLAVAYGSFDRQDVRGVLFARKDRSTPLGRANTSRDPYRAKAGPPRHHCEDFVCGVGRQRDKDPRRLNRGFEQHGLERIPELHRAVHATSDRYAAAVRRGRRATSPLGHAAADRLGRVDLPVMPPVKPMLAKPVPTLPHGEMSYEPKWDGFRCIVFRDGDDVVMGSRNEKPLNRYFPEMLEPLLQSLPERCVVDGELFVSLGGTLDFDALGQRIHPADSRVQMLARETPADFVAFDLLALGEQSLVDSPFAERRESLERISEAFTPPVHLAPATTDPVLAMEWFNTTESSGLDGLIIKPLAHPYAYGKRTQFKLKHVRSADCVVAGYRMHKSGDGVGSLILGLYGPDGRLHHVGVAASFTAKRRAELLGEVEPLALDDMSDHPWAEWMDAEANRDGTMPGAPNRWSGAGGRDHSWTPLRPERVVEVRYTWATSGRFRGTTKMLRWRPDREPSSCSTEQIAEPAPLTGDSPVRTIVE